MSNNNFFLQHPTPSEYPVTGLELTGWQFSSTSDVPTLVDMSFGGLLEKLKKQEKFEQQTIDNFPALVSRWQQSLDHTRGLISRVVTLTPVPAETPKEPEPEERVWRVIRINLDTNEVKTMELNQEEKESVEASMEPVSVSQ